MVDHVLGAQLVERIDVTCRHSLIELSDQLPVPLDRHTDHLIS
jgi:hypothetical protein